MKVVDLQLKLQKPFANLYRKRHVLIVCQNAAGKIILGSKQAYPKGISRLIGGGVGDGETFLEAAVREAKEELGCQFTDTDFKLLAKINLTAETSEGQFKLETYLHYLPIGKQKIKSGDDVDTLVYLDKDELLTLSQKFELLQGTFVSGSYSHNWADYGRVYGAIHRLAYELLP